MREERKRLFTLMTICILGLFALAMFLIAENQKLTEQRDNATEQVYILGSHLTQITQEAANQ